MNVDWVRLVVESRRQEIERMVGTWRMESLFSLGSNVYSAGWMG